MGPSLRVAGVLSLAIWLCARTPRPSPVSPDSRSHPSVWTDGFVYLKPGERERYFRFLEANWAQARGHGVVGGLIRSYRVLVAPDTTSGWQVMLLTEYTDASAFRASGGDLSADSGGTRPHSDRTRELTDSIVNRRVETFLGAS